LGVIENARKVKGGAPGVVADKSQPGVDNGKGERYFLGCLQIRFMFNLKIY
jgi:hypothetical protein